MNKSIALDIAEWVALCQDGACLPVKITLAGNSMHPLIRIHRDVVTIVPLYRSPKVGDVVLFARDDGNYVVHRLYKIKGETVQTLGDGCIVPDASMPITAICGLVTSVKRGRWVIRLDTAVARFFGRIWIGLLPFHQLIVRIKKRLRRKVRHEQ